MTSWNGLRVQRSNPSLSAAISCRRRPMSATTRISLAVADAVWAEIKSAGRASDEHLSILETLFGKNMLRACKIVDERGVRRVTGAPSGRSLFLVMVESKRKEEYLCFPEHLCTCYSFFYDIVGRGEQLCCKHQLAARLAEAVGEHQEIEVTDEELICLRSSDSEALSSSECT